MKIDLTKGVSLKIEGVLGEKQTLSIDKLIEISKSFQDLVYSLINNDVAIDEAVNLDNFKLELSDFSGGSAIPTFVLPNSNVQLTTNSYEKQKAGLEEKLDNVFQIMSVGEYAQLTNMYPDFRRRNEMVESIYNFSKSFNGSPVFFGNYNREKKEFNKLYNHKKFKPEVKSKLLVKVEQSESITEELAIGEIKITKKGNKKERTKITSIIRNANHSLSYSPSEININGRKYLLKSPLRCLLKKEDDIFIIQNELLDIVGTGEKTEEAELSFCEEFDFLYNRLNELTDSQLSTRMKDIKSYFKIFVASIQ